MTTSSRHGDVGVTILSERERCSSILIIASGFVYVPTSTTNLGDRAQLTCTVERLKARFPQSRLIAISHSVNGEIDIDDLEVSYSAIRYLTSAIVVPGLRLGLPAVLARILRTFLLILNVRCAARDRRPVLLSSVGQSAVRELKESSALFISGAGVFNDHYVRGVGTFWGVIARCMFLLGKPVVASGQQIGPLRKFRRRAMVRWALRPVNLLGVRDPVSMASTPAVGIPEFRVVLTGDDAWDLTPVAPVVAETTLAALGIHQPFIAAQMRFGMGWDEADSHGFAVSLNHLSEILGLPIVFVPSMTGSANDDRFAAACVQRHLRVPNEAIVDELDAQTTKAVLGLAVLGVGTANHFCVFGASMNTPVVGLYATPYMEQKLVGLSGLWPSRVTALPKEQGLDPPSLLVAARALLKRQVDKNMDSNVDQPSVELQPNEPIRFLGKLLAERPSSASRARFTDDAEVEAYERELTHGRFMQAVTNLERLALRRVLAPHSRTAFERHLDFACGSGRAIEFARGFAKTVVGVDISEAMLVRARARFPTAQFVCGDISIDPRVLNELGTFDLVTIWRFLAPAEPRLRLTALAAVAGSMNDGALLVVNNNANRTSLHAVGLVLRSLVRAQSMKSSIPYQGSLSHRELRRLLEVTGFHLEETKAICYVPEQITRRMPPWVWVSLERALGWLNIAPQHSVNYLVLARRFKPVEDRVGDAGV